MAEFDRLNSTSDWIDLEFVERERTPPRDLDVGIQLHIVGVSLSNTKQFLETLGVERSRTAIHNWVQRTDAQSDSYAESDHIAVNETVIHLNNQRHGLYAAVDPHVIEFLHVGLFQTRTTQLTVLFLRRLHK